MLARRNLTLLAIAALLGGGCHLVNPVNDPPPLATVSRPASASAMSAFSHAHQLWASVRRNPGTREAWLEAEELVLDQLAQAASTEPDCPLFASMSGRVALELALAESDVDAAARRLNFAKHAFDAALAGHPEWVPAWLGLAEFYLFVGQPTQASEALKGARAALASLEQFDDWTRSNVSAEHYGTTARSATNAAAPELTPQERFTVLSRWLDAESAWRIDATDLVEVAAEDALAVGRWGRLRARIELGAARLRAAEVDYEVARAREVTIAYDEALRWDPDLAEAHIELAKWCALAGDPALALGHAEPFLAGRYPLLESNEALLTLAAEAHAALFVRDAKRANFHDAAHYYERLLQVRGEDEALRLTVARHFVAGAERFRNVDLASEARRLVAGLEPALPESAALLARLDALETKRP